jgi:hypothetical protein
MRPEQRVVRNVCKTGKKKRELRTMERKSTSQETQGLSSDDPCDNLPENTYGDLDGGCPADAPLAYEGAAGREYYLESSRAGRFGAADPTPLSETIFSSRSPGAVQPGIFFGPGNSLRVAPQKRASRREALAQQADVRGFHDSELGDVYDLYNACNGAMVGGLLDVDKLDELSPEEKKELNVKRLKEVWHHTATGCATCAHIIRTLNAARGILREEREETRRNEPESED